MSEPPRASGGVIPADRRHLVGDRRDPPETVLPLPGGFSLLRTGPTVADLAVHIREATALRPGDVLVIQLAPECTKDEMETFTEHLKAQPLEGVKVVTIGGSVELHVLRAGDQP